MTKKKSKSFKHLSLWQKILIAIIIFIGAALLAALIYAAVVLASSVRIPDNKTLEIEKGTEIIQTEQEQTYKICTYNIGYGAYSDDYSFFMDGGVYSRAFSPTDVVKNTLGVLKTVEDINADIVLLQEVDTDSTRSYHINQYELIKELEKKYSSVYACNYDSAFLIYPFNDPIGASESGIMTLSAFGVERAYRRSLPIAKDLSKLADLDRCYTVSVIPAGDKKLYVINVHMSAFSNNDEVRRLQTQMLTEEMSLLYSQGNYIICGGDFNQCLLEDADEIFGERYFVSQEFMTEYLPEHFTICQPTTEKINPTNRDCSDIYTPGVSKVTVFDGFIISDNIELITLENLDNGFKHTDHEPAVMEFKLK